MARTLFNQEEQAIIRNLDLVLRSENVLNSGLGTSLVKKWNRCVRARAAALRLRQSNDEDMAGTEWSDSDWQYYSVTSSWHGFIAADSWLPALHIWIGASNDFFGNIDKPIRITISLKEFSATMRPRRRVEVKEFVGSLPLHPNPINVNGMVLGWKEEHGREGQRIFRHDTEWDFKLLMGSRPIVDATTILKGPAASGVADGCPVLSAVMLEYARYCRRFRDLKRQIYAWRDDG